MKIKTVFFGTHEFACTILQDLLDSPLVEVTTVVTQPDEPVGRKQILTPPPVKILAEKNHISVVQPVSLKSFDFSPFVSDINIVAQYGKLIPKSIIEAPRFGTLNVHTSLLPKYRGASPIQFALLQGEKETGVTIMKMDEGMDTGPILLQKKIPILPDETYLELDARLAHVGGKALLEALPLFAEGTLQPQAQNNAEATLTKLLSREDGKIDWRKNAEEIYNRYRGLTPWPGVWTMWNGKRIKLTTMRLHNENFPAGTVVSKNGALYIGTGNQSVEILNLQMEGKPVMDAKSFINGYKSILESTLE